MSEHLRSVRLASLAGDACVIAQSNMTFNRKTTLEALENEFWDDPKYESNLAIKCYQLRKVPINELSGGFNAILSRLQRPEDDSVATTQTKCSMNEKPMHRFIDEFKKNAVQLVIDNGYSCTEVVRRLNVNHTNVARWVRESRDESDVAAESNTQRDLEAENKRPKKEKQRLFMERDILKKAAAFFANESK